MKFSLLTRFTLLTLAVFAVLGWQLSESLVADERADELTRVQQIAELQSHEFAERVTVEGRFRARDEIDVRALDELVEQDREAGFELGAAILTERGEVLYSSAPGAGRRGLGPERSAALDGRTVVALDTEGGGADAYVPLRAPGGSRPLGTFELDLDGARIEAGIAAEAAGVRRTVAAAFLVLFVVLFPVVAAASRRLRRHARDSEHHALHDDLTGLPNRRLLMRELTRRCRPADAHLALMVFDLDGFKHVNDALGHDVGDQLLRAVAPRLTAAVGDGALVARLGGDEFAALLPDVGEIEAAHRIAAGVHEALDTSVQVAGVGIRVEASVGIALFPRHAADASQLLAAADAAMYSAKRARAGTRAYCPEVDGANAGDVQLLAELRDGLDRDELVLHYQPQVGPDGAVVGVEALVRWRHPTRGELLPGRFLALAEGSGLMTRLTLRVLDLALCQCRRWLDAGLELDVAVNISPRTLLDANLVSQVTALLARHRVPPARLRLEITESGMVTDPDAAAHRVALLADAGVEISIDDFGTGYSSLGRLQRMSIHELKIDRSFVLALEAEQTAVPIVRSIVELAQSLDLRVVAEGVESDELFAQLEALGCDRFQGYGIARPMPADALSAWLAARAPLGVLR